MKALIIALTVALASSAEANTPPPPHFDYPFAGELLVNKLPRSKLREVCMEPRALGCAFTWADRSKCVVYIIDRRTHRVWPADVLAHELAHCNGWNSQHDN